MGGSCNKDPEFKAVFSLNRKISSLGYVRTCLTLFKCFELLKVCHRARKANTKHCLLFADPSSKPVDVSIQPGVIAQPGKQRGAVEREDALEKAVGQGTMKGKWGSGL